MATPRTARTRGPRARDAPVSPARSAAAGHPLSPGLIGLCAVVMALPLLVLPAAAGPYDDPKVWALPLLTGATLLAWLWRPVAMSAASPNSRKSRAERALGWAIAGCFAWWLVTTGISLAPGQSVVGVFGRGVGLLTVASAALLFFVVRSECRTGESVRALIDAALLGSVPVCLLALSQALGRDPLPKVWDPAVVTLTVRSTFGQHIFLGSYLAVLTPLAAARLDSSLKRPRAGPDSERGRVPLPPLIVALVWILGAVALVGLSSAWTPGWWLLGPWGVAGAVAWVVARAKIGDPSPGWLPIACLSALVAAQALVMLLSRARGPLLGLLLGLAVAGFVLYARRRAWKAVVVMAGAVAAVTIVLVLLNVPHSPLAPLAKLGVISRLSQMTDVNTQSPVWFRLQVWRGVLNGWGRQLRGEELIPGTHPWVRSAVGYGLETQLLTLDPLSRPTVGFLGVGTRTWQGQYLVDRAHNALLDQLVTVGMVGVTLWLVLGCALLAVGIARIRTARTMEETTLRLGCLGALVAHVAEGQVGIVTATPLALSWIAAGLLVSPTWSSDDARPSAAPSRRDASWWPIVPAAITLVILLDAWVGTRWLMASAAYGEGARRQIAGQVSEAHANFRRSQELAPWLSITANAAAYTALSLAGNERNLERRRQLLIEGAAALAEARRHVQASGPMWALTAQIALAESKAGDRSKLSLALEAFEMATRLQPSDAQLIAQWGSAWLDVSQPRRAREAAERAIQLSEGRDWLAWAVLSRSASELGDSAEARRAADIAWRRAPASASSVLQNLLR